MMTRLYYISSGPRLEGVQIRDRLRVIGESAVGTLLRELIGSNSIPTSNGTLTLEDWVHALTRMVKFDINPERFPYQMMISVKELTEAVFTDEQVIKRRRGISPFIQAASMAGRTLHDDTLRLELEQRGLEEAILPKSRPTLTEGRARIASQVQQSLVDMESHRMRQQEEQKKLDKEAKELADTGFGRKVELD